MSYDDRDCRCELQELSDEQDLTIRKLGDILTKIANTLKGPPGELQRHSWHDLPQIVENLKNAHVSLSKQFDDNWYECHDGSESACSKAHE